MFKRFTEEEKSRLLPRLIRKRIGRGKNNHKQSLECSFGCKNEENQEHQLECEFILNELKEDKYLLAECEYSDIFGDIKQQENIIKIFVKILNIREDLLIKT